MWARGRTTFMILYGATMALVFAYIAWRSHQTVLLSLQTYGGEDATIAVSALKGMLRDLAIFALVVPALMIWHLIDFKIIDKKAPFTFVTFLFVLLAILFYLAALGQTRSTSLEAASAAMGAAAVALALFVAILWAYALSRRAAKLEGEQPDDPFGG